MTLAVLYGCGFAGVLLALLAGGVLGMAKNAAPRPPRRTRKTKNNTA